MFCGTPCSKLSEILDVMAPIRSFQVRTKYVPWMSQNTKNTIKERNLAQQKANRTKDKDDWRYYRKLRKEKKTLAS